MTAQHFKWLPNALTILRILSAGVVCWAAANGRWTLAFWLLVAGLFTDFLDGLAAKKLNAITALGTQLDRYADMLISAGAMIGLAIAGLLSWWIILFGPIVGIFLAEERFFYPKKGLLHRRRPIMSVIYLFAVWIFVCWMYISQAYGWQWWYVPLTAGYIIVSALLKQHRLRAWLGGEKP
jgi:phosphatidylglycerophosphate synthase